MKKSRKFQKQISIASLRGSDKHLRQLLRELSSAKGFSNLPIFLLRDLKLVLVEAVTNAFRHGQGSRKKPVKVLLKADPKFIEIQVKDWGRGFPLDKTLRAPSEALATEGRGIWIMKNLMDQIRYQRGRPNCLKLIRKLTRPRSLDSALELFHLLQESIQNLKPLDTLYEEFIDFVVDQFNVERASFLIFDPDSRSLQVATSRGIPQQVAEKISVAPGEGIAGYVFQTGRPMLVQNLRRMIKAGPQPRKKGYTTSSFISVPVIASPLHMGEETLGVLNLTDRRDGRPFTQKDLKLLNLMATQAAAAFRIRILLEAIKQHEGINRELEIVREIQDRLIPEKFPPLAASQLGGICQLSLRGGGDYYDVLKVNGTLRGVIADVSGHHVGSAITMASFRSVFRSLVFDPNTPGRLLQALRWAIHEELVSLHQFISCWVFEYRKDGTLTVSGAGHPPLMIFHPKKKSWSTHFSQHLPLGLEDDSRIQNTRIQLRAGDLALFYTDGLFDPRMRVTGFDRQRVLDVVEKNFRRTPQAIIEKIFHEMKPHHALLSYPDDVAVLALKRR